MAVAESGSPSVGHFEANTVDSHVDGDLDGSSSNQFSNESDGGESNPKPKDQSNNYTSQSLVTDANGNVNDEDNNRDKNGNTDGTNQNIENYHALAKSDSYGTDNGSEGGDYRRNEENVDGLKQNIRELEEMLSKLNPMAKEFVPSSGLNHRSFYGSNFDNFNNILMRGDSGNGNGYPSRRKKNSFGQGKRRMNSRTNMAQREEVIRRTVYVSDLDQQVTEEQLAVLFINCGQVVDCRVCGDPNSVLRFAFVEFTDEEGARNALTLSGTMLGYYPVRILPSKTAIAPVNPTYLPRSEDEREMCARTVYCTNIDRKTSASEIKVDVVYKHQYNTPFGFSARRKGEYASLGSRSEKYTGLLYVTQADVKLFFESLCGEVLRLRLLGDFHHSTRIAFVEFVLANSAIAALNCSGAMLGSLPIRVSPSKTPVRPRSPRVPLN